MHKGYWRCHNRSSAFIRCLHESACPGGGTVGTCGEGHRGPLCAVCEPGLVDVECRKCSVAKAVVVILGPMLLLLLLLVWTTFRAFVRHPASKRLLTISIWKRSISFLQTMSSLKEVCGAGGVWFEIHFHRNPLRSCSGRDSFLRAHCIGQWRART